MLGNCSLFMPTKNIKKLYSKEIKRVHFDGFKEMRLYLQTIKYLIKDSNTDS